MTTLPSRRLLACAVWLGYALLLTALFSGCADGNNHFDRLAVAGVASKGPLAGATITIFLLTPEGQRGMPVAPEPGMSPILTAADGSWTAALPLSSAGPFLVVATGGAYFDEATGTQVELEPTAEILGLLPEGDTSVAITPLTHALAFTTQHALQQAAVLGHMVDRAGLITAVIANATQTFGFDPVHTLPPDPRRLTGRSTAEVQYAAVLGGLAQLLAAARARAAAGTEPVLSLGVRLEALATDLTDGILDGQQGGQAMTLPDGTALPSLLPDPQTTSLAQVANAFATDPPPNAGLDRTGFQQLATTAPVRITPPAGGNFTGTNTAPVPTDDTATTVVATAITIPAVANDHDADSNELTVSTVTQGSHGTVTITNAGQAVLYTPAANFRGTDSFTYTLRDGQGGTATATVRVTVVNRLPVAQDDTATTPAGTTVTVAVLANDRDADGDALTVSSVTLPGHGTATLQADGTVQYAPQAGFRGADSFTYTLSDGRGGTATATVHITVQAPGKPRPLYLGQKVPVGVEPSSVVVADLNGDGRLDLVTTNVGSGDVSVVLGQGDGTFEPEQRLAAGRFPVSVAVADMDGDSRPDLVTANTFSNDVSVLLHQ